MSDQPTLRDRALAAAAVALNTGRYWLPAEAQAAVVDAVFAVRDATPHVCRPGASLYYCPTFGRTESDCHGGHDVCCDRPDLHQLACAHCGGTGGDPEDPGDYDAAVHQFNPGTRGPCPECIQKGLPPRLGIPPHAALGGDKISLRKADVDLATAVRSRDGWRRDYADLAEAYKRVYARADQAEAALGRVRAVAEELIKYGCPWTGSEPEAGRRTLAALEPPKEP